MIRGRDKKGAGPVTAIPFTLRHPRRGDAVDKSSVVKRSKYGGVQLGQRSDLEFKSLPRAFVYVLGGRASGLVTCTKTQTERRTHEERIVDSYVYRQWVEFD